MTTVKFLKLFSLILKPFAIVILLPIVLLFLLFKQLATWANYRFSLVGDHFFFEKEKFAWVPDVEAATPAIQAELEKVLQVKEQLPNFQDVLKGQARLTNDNKWKTYFFYMYGEEVESNCKDCPDTIAALQKIPGLKTAFFSILEPRKHIPPHEGPFNGVLRYHLGLRIPGDNDCRIRVGDELGYWSDGDSLVFDDSYEHEAWNDTDSERVVLFVDFERPLPFFARSLNRFVLLLASKLPPVKLGVKAANEWTNRQVAVN